MPLYLDIHTVTGATVDDVARAHAADMAIQNRYGVEYTKYWFNERQGKVFCLCTAPSAEAAALVHREAHGLVAEKVIQVDPDLIEGLLGSGVVNEAGAAMLPGAPDDHDPGIRVVMFTDIVGSTAFTQKYGDRAAMDLVQVHDRIVRDALGGTGGREVKHTGDGIMASFASAPAAVKCAAEIQQKIAEYDRRGEYDLKLRIGAAAGEPIEHHNDLFGSTVQLAARLCAHAEPAQGLASSAVAELCPGQRMRPLGEVALKGFERPVRVYLMA
jgi:class 3 adenylate cyclase